MALQALGRRKLLPANGAPPKVEAPTYWSDICSRAMTHAVDFAATEGDLQLHQPFGREADHLVSVRRDR